MGEVIFRRPYAKEMEAVYELRHEVLGEPIERSREKEAEVVKEAAEGRIIHAAGFDGEKVVATGRISEDLYRQWMVRHVAVHPDYRGKNLGSAIMAYLEHAAVQQGMVVAEVKARHDAEGFYRKLGYSSMFPAYNRFGIPHIRMRKELEHYK